MAAVPGSEKLPVSGSEIPILIGAFAAASSVPAPTWVATSSAAATVSGTRSQRSLRIDVPPSLSWTFDTFERLPLLAALQRQRVEREQLQLGHLFNGVPEALAAGSGILDAAVGHVVDAERRHVVDHQPARVDPVERLLHDPQVAREDPRLEAELAGPGAVDCLVHVVVAVEDDERRERLLAGDTHVLLRVGEHRRFPHPSLALAAGEHGRTVGHGLLDPRLDALGGAVVDQ